MDLEAKKNILLSIVAATEQEEVIDLLITTAWNKETEPKRSILLKDGKPPTEYKSRRTTIHGKEYKSLRYACCEVWGLTEAEYSRITRELKKGMDVDDLLQPRREPTRKVIPTDKFGVAK